MSWAVPKQYVREANSALLDRLHLALVEENWDAVEATAGALHELALTFTKPKGKNA